ncbi:AAA family ATPase [Rhodopirellula sp. MGV]|uniref:AAA family ATPase n=1 Tax=Rhodopirellula sp. MGV TaxID=2023130 RepID=UPI0018E9A29D|nr:MoxR family ATPase [Rhodopirellula sp. MGV]
MNNRRPTLSPDDFERLDSDEPIVLKTSQGVPEQVHVFDDPRNLSRLAVKAALASGRPLLVRGDPGVGKTQLAAAVAIALQRPLVPYVVDARSESRDLLWQFDTVRRLAEAQICGVLRTDRDEVEERLRVSRFIEPGPLWWGFDWKGAKEHCELNGLEIPSVPVGTDPKHGRVVLIDEIDKADIDLPNGLLEALGSGRFRPQGCPDVVMSDPAPLVIVTTNEERVLPDAFVRRCLVLHLELPEKDSELIELLVKRGERHFKDASETLLTKAAQMLVADRRVSPRPRPGQAEYFDLVRAILNLVREGEDEVELLSRLKNFAFKKNSGAGA